MLPRFLVPAFDPERAFVELPPEEGHHLSRVLRLRAGDDVAVFDGRGREFRGRIASVDRDRVSVQLLEAVQTAAEPSTALTLVVSVIKGEGMNSVIRDCTMVGVHAIRPVVSARTTVKASTLPAAVERWRRVALASAKQCGRARLPEIGDVGSYDDWVRNDSRQEPAFILLEPGTAPREIVTVRDLARRDPPPRASLIVGPEGGWTPAERDLALEHGCVPLSLGPMTLRADAVPLAASAALLAVWY